MRERDGEVDRREDNVCHVFHTHVSFLSDGKDCGEIMQQLALWK